MVRADSVQIDGKVSYFDQTADGGNIKSSGFCSVCGAPVVAKSSGYPDSLFFHAATLDDPGQFRPQKVVYHTSSQPWDYIDPSLDVL